MSEDTAFQLGLYASYRIRPASQPFTGSQQYVSFVGVDTSRQHHDTASDRADPSAEMQEEAPSVMNLSQQALPSQEATPEEMACIACLDNTRTMIFVECRHLVYCLRCRNQAAHHLYGQSISCGRAVLTCPVCRRQGICTSLKRTSSLRMIFVAS